MIDMSLLRGVWVDPARRIARAQAGCTLGDVDRETQLHGLAAVLGFVSATGIAGLTVGGGFGYLTRSYGWTCDNVVVDGGRDRRRRRCVRASGDENAELFWALRGGSGNFGIVTSFEYELVPGRPRDPRRRDRLARRGRQAGARGLPRVQRQAPRELTSVAVLRIAPPAPWLPKEVHGKPIVALFVCHSGKVEDGEALLAPLRALRPAGRRHRDARGPTRRCRACSTRRSRRGGATTGSRTTWRASTSAWSSWRPSTRRGSARRTRRSCCSRSRARSTSCRPATRRSATATRRTCSTSPARGSRPADDASNIAWARDCFEATRAFSTGGTYVNFLTEEEGRDRIAAAYSRSGPARARGTQAPSTTRRTCSVTPRASAG